MARSMLLVCSVCWCLSSIAAGSLPQENVAQIRKENDKILPMTAEDASVKDTRAAQTTGKTTDVSTSEAALSGEDEEEVNEGGKSLDEEEDEEEGGNGEELEDGEEGEDGEEVEDGEEGEDETESDSLVETSEGSLEDADDGEDGEDEDEDEEDEDEDGTAALIQRGEDDDDEEEDADADEDDDDDDEDEDKAKETPTSSIPEVQAPPLAEVPAGASTEKQDVQF